jgi:hypothetical protein
MVIASASAVYLLCRRVDNRQHASDTFEATLHLQKHPATMKLYLIAALAAIVMATLPRGSYATQDVILNFKVLDCNNQ